MDKKLNIQCVVTKDQVFIKGNKNLYFNGKTPSPSNKDGWVVIDGTIEKVEEKINGKKINYRFELKDPERFPNLDSTLKVEDVFLDKRQTCYSYIDEDDYYDIAPSYRDIISLYDIKSDRENDYFKELDFELEVLAEIDSIDNSCFTYKLRNGNRSSNVIPINHKNISHYLVDELLYPEILLNNKSCFLSVKQTYDIVRSYIQDHIDNSVSVISSDYDFCFSVSKRIKLSKPYTSKREILNRSGKSYSRPRYNERYIDKKEIKVFEMAPKVYQSYPVIEQFRGDNISDLKKNIDNYLEDLITKINTPLKECCACNGLGVLNE